MQLLFAIPVILALLYFLLTPIYPIPEKATAAVLVTGASSGIGKDVALHLADLGYLVYAGVRKESDAEMLNKINPSIMPIILDVTVPSQIAAAATAISGETARPLCCIINNAGVQELTPLEFSDPAGVAHAFNVNVLGLLDVTRAFLPIIRRSPSPRIINVGSIAGFFTPPFYGVYGATKHAVEALSDSLRRELAPMGVSVSLLEPGSIDTPIEAKMLEQLGRHAEPTYGDRIGKFSSFLQALLANEVTRKLAFSPTSATTASIVHALEAKRPKTRYLVGVDAYALRAVAPLLPDRIVDLAFKLL